MIKFCLKASKSAMETSEMLNVAYSESVMFRASVIASSHRVESVGDNVRCNRSCTTETDEKITLVAAMLKEHCNSDCRLVKELTGISKTII